MLAAKSQLTGMPCKTANTVLARLIRLIDPEQSQAVYDAFKLNVDSAEQLTMDCVTGAADARVGSLQTLSC